MRNTWNLPLPQFDHPASSAQESESLPGFTPTSEIPNPEIVLPGSNTTDHDHLLDRTKYFSMVSNSSHTLSEAEPISPPHILPRMLVTA
jgi:hypothetical protein